MRNQLVRIARTRKPVRHPGAGFPACIDRPEKTATKKRGADPASSSVAIFRRYIRGRKTVRQFARYQTCATVSWQLPV